MSLEDCVSLLAVMPVVLACLMRCLSVSVDAQLHLDHMYTQCPDLCSCYNRMTTVDCRESGLYSVPVLPNTTTHVYLQANNLHHLAHYAFHFSPELHVLNLRENELTVFDTYSFAGLDRLEHIDLRHNRIAFVKLSTHSDSVLDHLRDVDLSNNRLQRVPANLSVFAPNLRALNLSSNLLTTLHMDVSYASMNKLERLDLSANRIIQLDGAQLDAIRTLPIRSLSLASCAISELHADAFYNLLNLTSLTLADNPIPVNQLGDALSGLGPDNHLISLNLNEVALINVSASTFETLGLLEALSLSNCSITNIDERLFSTLSDLRVLHINDNYLRAVDNINSATRLHHLDVSNNFISSLNLSGLYDLEVVEAANNYIETLPSHFLTNVTNIRIVNLSHNRITQISRVAFYGVGIVHLDLSYNRIRTLDAMGAYTCNTLDISYNHINRVKPAALRPLANSLRHLDFSHNNVTHFTNSHKFPVMSELQRLDLSYNNLGAWYEYNNVRSDDHTRGDGEDNDVTIAGKSSMLFNGLVALQILDLSANNISFLSAQTTRGVRHLTALYLRHNAIVDVLALRLDKLTSLLQLDASYNDVPSLDARALLALDYLQAVDLAYNPFSCDCDSIMDALRWLNTTSVHVLGISDHQQYQCTSPQDLAGTYLLSTRLTSRRCQPHVHDVSYDLTLFAITVAAVLLATILSTMFVYCSRLCQCIKALHYRWQVRYREVSAVEFHKDQKA